MIMSAMSSFKRKRIETWCEEVAQYLRNGTICRSVIGHVAEDGICGNSVVSAGENGEHIENRENILNHNGGGVDAIYNGRNGTSHSNNRVENAHRINGHALGAADSLLNTKRDSISGSFPFVKLTYNHYHEQRRKIDRLVQGLPVLNANSVSTIDRPSSKASTDDHVPIIIVNGEEPVRNPHTRSRSSSQPRRHTHQHSHAHFVSGSHTHNNNGLQLQAPHTARQLAAQQGAGHFRSASGPRRSGNHVTYEPGRVRRSNSGAARLYDVKHSQMSPEVAVTVDPDLGLSSAERIDRIKTAPAPNRNVTRARQRILNRRNNNRVLEHTSQIPLQNCWAMAELTW
ncbi:uncharacterized protein LOC101863324 [Aplysia californica]|uniref:Uncharacterized protein LOC101863324 n=1 Tax=Aplysia californica TaxID=6500 RepID=A0ABM0JF60_APLCA|nr:uncharacterized protein LOC101863324 [Aplysia californica]XP_005092299.1 uncharacterized protein LOC101863324 [Aplysia californica]